MENKQLFDYMQDCKTNVRQCHKRLECLMKCVETALFYMSLSPSDSQFKDRLTYKPHLTFFYRNYSEFKI